MGCQLALAICDILANLYTANRVAPPAHRPRAGRFTRPARAGNRLFGRLSALRTHTKAPQKTDLYRKTLKALNRHRRPGPSGHGSSSASGELPTQPRGAQVLSGICDSWYAGAPADGAAWVQPVAGGAVTCFDDAVMCAPTCTRA